MSSLPPLCWFFLPRLRQNIPVFPCHGLHINTGANYKAPICVWVHHWLSFFPHASILLARRNLKKQFSTDTCSTRGFGILLKDNSTRRKCTEPSSLIFVLCPLIIILPLIYVCLLLCGEPDCGTPGCLKAPYKYTCLNLTWKTDRANQQWSPCLLHSDNQLYLGSLVSMATPSSL